jgi:hypothetical protein
MRKIIWKSGLVLLTILLATVSSFAQTQELSGGKISFSETMWDFGHVPKTGIVSHTYLIKNIGQDTLIIVKVRPTCGCTTTPLSHERLAPNQTTEMKIFYDPRKILTGEAVKKLQIISSDPSNPIAEVQFSAKTGINSSLVKLTPTEINFDTVVLGAEDFKTLTIENISGEKLSLQVIEGPGENVDLNIGSKTLRPAESLQITLKLKKGVALGDLHTSFTLEFEGSKTSRVSIPIFGVIASK